MRWSIVAAVLSVAACSEDVAGGPAFGSGASGATASDATAGATASPDDRGSSTDATPETTAAATDDPSNSTTGGPTADTSASDTSASDTSASGAGPSTSGVSGETSTDDTAASGDGTPLDPDLDVPDAGEPCTTPGSLNECPGVAVCRFYTAEEGRCESCEACGNLGDPCTDGTDCDILFACFAGRCTNICPLGTFYCGPVEDCLEVGHPTHGVCDPFA